MNVGMVLEMVYLVCPSWPSSTSPASEQEALDVRDYFKQMQITPCIWTSDRYVEDDIDPAYWNMKQNMSGSAVFARKVSETRSNALKRTKKSFRCMTHDQPPEMAYLRHSAFYYRVMGKLRMYWEEKYVKNENGAYPSMMFRMYRKRVARTISQMWNG